MQGPHFVHSANFRRQKLDKQENAPEIDPRPLAMGEEKILGNILFQLNENTTLEYNNLIGKLSIDNNNFKATF